MLNAIRASVSGSMFARAAYVWALDLALGDAEVPKELKDDIKKIAIASAFAEDATMDALQMALRAMAYSVAARLKCWQGYHSEE